MWTSPTTGRWPASPKRWTAVLAPFRLSSPTPRVAAGGPFADSDPDSAGAQDLRPGVRGPPRGRRSRAAGAFRIRARVAPECPGGARRSARAGLAADPTRADAIALRSNGAAGVRRTRSRGNRTIARLKPGLPLSVTRLHPPTLTARRLGDGRRPRQSISLCSAVCGSSPARAGARLVGCAALPWRPVRAWPDPAIGWPAPGGSARRRVSLPPGRSDLALRESARF